MLPYTSFVAAFCLTLTTANFAAPVPPAQSPKADTSSTTQMKLAPTRADLARAYLRFETALKEHPPAAERIADINRAFDKLTLDFFMGNGAAAVKALDELTTTVDPSALAKNPLERALSIRTTPRTLKAGDPLAIEVNLRLIYELNADIAPSTTLTLTARALETSIEGIGAPIATAHTTFADILAGLGTARATLNANKGWVRPATATAVRVTLAIADAPARTIADLPFLDRSLDAARDSNEARIAAIQADDPPMQQALAACQARNALLAGAPSENDSSQFLADVAVLVRDIEREIEQLEKGQDPYRRRVGDLWRVVRVGTRNLPVRVFAPERAASDEKIPLVIALHGAGGDENMFFDGYGAGKITELARAKNFVVVAPRLGFAGIDAASFDAIVNAIVFDYAIDPKRIYVIGHSMGAGAAFTVATSRSDRIAATCCIAGGPMGGAPPKACTPLLVYGGELDPLASATSLSKGVARLKDSGLDVEFRLGKNWGHTLLVGEKLPEIVDWLLAKSR